MKLTVTYSSGTSAGTGYTRVGHSASLHPDSVWSFTLTQPVTDLTFALAWNNTAAGVGWRGKYNYAFALSNDGAANKQLAKGTTNISKVVTALDGKTGKVDIKFNVQLNAGTYYLRANQNGTTKETMKAFSTTVSGSATEVGEVSGGGGIPARKIYLEKSIKKADDDNTVDRMIMVGYGGAMMSSTNGTSWSNISTGTTETLYGVDFVGAKYIACGTNGKVITSSNMGSTWTAKSLSTVAFEGAAYSDGLYVVAGGDEVWVSNDATNWELSLKANVASNGTGTHFEGVIWDGEKFIVYGIRGVNYISNDGYSWDVYPIHYTNPGFIKIVKAEGHLYAIPWWAGSWIMRSSDGYNWEYVVEDWAEEETRSFVSIAYGNGTLVAVGELGMIMYSDDGENWTKITWANQTNWDNIGYGFGKFVVVGTSVGDTGYRGYSEDGATWTGFTSLSFWPTSVTFGLSQYHYDIRQTCYEELMKRQAINKVEGQVENTLPPKYGEDYRLGDIVEVNAAGWQGRQRITKVRHVLEPNRISITPVIGDDFLDLRQFISREVNK